MTTTKFNTFAPEPHLLQKQIGSTLFRVTIRCSENAKETLEEKILRLLKNDLQSSATHGNMNPLQECRLSEKGLNL